MIPLSDGASRSAVGSSASDAPLPPSTCAVANRRNGLWAGAVLVVVGVYFLLHNLGLVDWVQWSLAWPVILIGIGLYFVLRRFRR